MEILPLPILFVAIAALILLSAFFSGSETGMMAINRYKLRHMANQGSRKAKRVKALIDAPDRLLSIILIGNTFSNNFSASIATLVGAQLYGEVGIVLAPILLTIIVLIFYEVAPKTVAAMKPEWIAFKAAPPLQILLIVLYPLVWLVNGSSNFLLRCLGLKIHKKHHTTDHLNTEELRTLVLESSSLIPNQHRQMLLSILDLEHVSVEGIMLPKQEIIGIDLHDKWDSICHILSTTTHHVLPVYRGDIDDVLGMLFVRDAWSLLLHKKSGSKEKLEQLLKPCYFIPEGTPLQTQLLQFQKHTSNIALVVNEYGDIQGLITLEDILEEIVGELSSSSAKTQMNVHPQEDGSYIVDGSATLRELKRELPFRLPEGSVHTLSGTIIDYLEYIPEQGTSLKLNNIVIEILQVKNNTIKKVRMSELT